MTAILAIARNTFREAVRDRVLYLFLGFAILVLVASKLFGMLTVGDEAKVIKDLGLAGIQFFSMLIAVMMSVTLISREVEQRTVFNILAKPVRRWQFLCGKYLGLMLTVALNLLLMAVLLVGLLWIYQGVLEARLFLAAGMIFFEMMVVAAAATFFAVVTKAILGSVLTLAFFFIGHLTEDLWLLTRHLADGVSQRVIAAVYYLLPNLDRFNIKHEVVHSLPLSGASLAWAVIYALLFSSLILLLACFQFSRKDLA